MGKDAMLHTHSQNSQMSPENRNQFKNERFPLQFPTSNVVIDHCSLVFHRTSRPLVCLRRESIPFSKLIWQWKKNNFETHRCSEDGRKALKWQTRSYGTLCSLGSWCLAKSPDSWAPFSDYILLPPITAWGCSCQSTSSGWEPSLGHWDCPGSFMNVSGTVLYPPVGRPFSDTVVSVCCQCPCP